MRDANSDLLICGIVMLYTLWAYWAFKMYDALIWEDQPANEEKIENKQTAGWVSQLSDVSISTVSKTGAASLILWSFFLVGVLLNYRGEPKSASKKKRYQILGAINLTFAFVFSLTSFNKSWPLFVRAFPFLGAQFAVSVWLLQKSDCDDL